MHYSLGEYADKEKQRKETYVLWRFSYFYYTIEILLLY